MNGIGMAEKLPKTKRDSTNLQTKNIFLHPIKN